jgi:ribosomal protein L11 methyltransferase
MPFLALSFELGAVDPDLAESVCFAAGALAVTLADARDDAVLEPAPGEVRLWPATRLEALFPGQSSASALGAELAAALGLPASAFQAHALADRAWEREWLRDFHAMRFGERLWVCPHHETVTAADAVVVRLDPGLAFGTGTHATTALCLAWLDEHLRPGARVIDYGCGSGILAIAALQLGAAAASCFDIDPQALTATAGNAAANNVAARLNVCTHADDLPREVDVLLANILAGPLRELAPRCAALVRPGGTVVLSGLLEPQESDVTAAYDAWFDMRRFAVRDGWLGLAGSRRSVRAPTTERA